MLSLIKRSTKGFTIIEMIIVILICSILAAIAIPQFIDYRKEAKDAKTLQYLGVIRVGIANQYAQQILRCSARAGDWSKAASIAANDVTVGAGAPCLGSSLGNVAAEKKFVADANFPENPWSSGNLATARSVTACVDSGGNNGIGGGCTRCAASGCDNSSGHSQGWCYNEHTGDFWADSANNFLNSGVANSGTECNF